MGLASCSMAYQPQEQQPTEPQRQCKFIGINALEQPMMMLLQDASNGDIICEAFGILTADGLDGEYNLFYGRDKNGQYAAAQTFDIEPDETYVYRFQEFWAYPGGPSLGWRFIRE